MLSSVCFSRIYYRKETKMLKLETLFMLVNAVLYEYGPRFCVYDYTYCLQKWVELKPHLKVFLRKSFKF